MRKKINFNMEKILLSDAEMGKKYIVKNILIEDKKLLNQLSNIGLAKGAAIMPVKYNFLKKALLIKIMGINFDIDKLILESVEIELCRE